MIEPTDDSLAFLLGLSLTVFADSIRINDSSSKQDLLLEHVGLAFELSLEIRGDGDGLAKKLSTGVCITDSRLTPIES